MPLYVYKTAYLTVILELFGVADDFFPFMCMCMDDAADLDFSMSEEYAYIFVYMLINVHEKYADVELFCVEDVHSILCVYAELLVSIELMCSEWYHSNVSYSVVLKNRTSSQRILTSESWRAAG